MYDPRGYTTSKCYLEITNQIDSNIASEIMLVGAGLYNL